MIRKLIYRLTVAVLRTLVRPHHSVHFRLTILKLDRLGDAVLSLGAVRILTSKYGEEQTLLIVSKSAAVLYRHEFPAASLLVMPPFCQRFWPDYLISMVRHAHELRAISTDDLVCLRHQHSDYLHSLALMMNAGRCHAAKWEGNRQNMSLAFPRCSLTSYPETCETSCLEIEAHRRGVAEVVGDCELDQVLPILRGVQVVHGDGLLVCPMAGDPIRQYPADQLAECIRLFLEKGADMGIRFCMPPGTDSEPWLAALNSKGLASVEWIFPMDELALVALIAESRLILAPDSAPAHIATALDKPGVFLLGGGHFGMFAPWHRSNRQQWLSHSMDCYRCQWCCIHPEAYCITQIKPEDIAQALWSLDQALGESANTPNSP